MPVIQRNDIQGNILNGYNKYRHVSYLLVSAPDTDSARNVLAALVDGLTTAEEWPKVTHPRTALNLAITHAGFAILGLPDRTLQRFPTAFRDGTRKRAESLGDVGRSAPNQWDPHYGTEDLHLLVTVHGCDSKDRDEERDRVRALITKTRARLLFEQHARQLLGKREHFGFADGSAQPDIEGVTPLGAGSARGGGVPLTGGGWRPIKLGEFVLGYKDEDGHVTEAPTRELVRNGSYLVLRKLYQDVAKFWSGLRVIADEHNMDPELLAAKMVGRWRDGTPLLHRHDGQHGDLSAVAVPYPSNDFRYLDEDREGYICPVGAHIRRANPRDAMDFDGQLNVTRAGKLAARHRIIRRGMPYGPDYDPSQANEYDDRGLIFACYNADLERQFELLQARWCGDADADTRGGSENRDYVLGASAGSGKVTVPRRDSFPLFVPVMTDVVITKGSEYLFAPGINALRGLATGRFS